MACYLVAISRYLRLDYTRTFYYLPGHNELSENLIICEAALINLGINFI